MWFHFRTCEYCILKENLLHNPLLYNQVAFINYKSYILFLTYSMAYFGYISTVVVTGLFKHSLHGLSVWTLASVLCLSICAFIIMLTILIFHIVLILRNRTTQERIFGPNWRYWLIPEYRCREDNNVYSMKTVEHELTTCKDTSGNEGKLIPTEFILMHEKEVNSMNYDH